MFVPMIRLAFGIARSATPGATTATRIDQLDASLPPDRASEWQDTRAQLPQVLRARHDAERALGDSQARLDEASRSHWGRHDRDAIAAAQGRVAYNQQRLRSPKRPNATSATASLALTYQQERRQAITNSAPGRQKLASSLAQLDAALDYTRPQRVHGLVSDFTWIWSSVSASLRHQPPAGPCGAITPYPSKLPSTATTASARRGQAGADRPTGRASRSRSPTTLQVESDGVNPADWAEVAQSVGTIRRKQDLRDLRVRNAYEQTMTPTHEAEHHLGIDLSAGPRGPEIGL